jgi:hypothetical protein
MENKSCFNLGSGNGSGRRVPTLVGLRCLRHYLHSGASLDHLESTTTQHPSPWNSLGLMELHDFQRIGFGLGARSYSPGRCRQHYPSQTLSLGRARSVGSCAGRLRRCNKLRYNELLHYSLLRFLDQSAVSQFLEPQDLALLEDSRLDSMFSWQQCWF